MLNKHLSSVMKIIVKGKIVSIRPMRGGPPPPRNGKRHPPHPTDLEIYDIGGIFSS